MVVANARKTEQNMLDFSTILFAMFACMAIWRPPLKFILKY